MIQVLDTDFPEAKLYTPDVFDDPRGYFKETFSTEKYAALGMRDVWVQDSVSRSKRNVIRGMHYDMRMAKFVQVLLGSIFDVIVDLREGSPDYKRWQGFELTGDNHRQLYVPKGYDAAKTWPLASGPTLWASEPKAQRSPFSCPLGSRHAGAVNGSGSVAVSASSWPATME